MEINLLLPLIAAKITTYNYNYDFKNILITSTNLLLWKKY